MGEEYWSNLKEIQVHNTKNTSNHPPPLPRAACPTKTAIFIYFQVANLPGTYPGWITSSWTSRSVSNKLLKAISKSSPKPLHCTLFYKDAVLVRVYIISGWFWVAVYIGIYLGPFLSCTHIQCSTRIPQSVFTLGAFTECQNNNK